MTFTVCMAATLYAMNSSNSAHSSDSGELLECVEVSTSDNPEYSVIWLHGLGADGHDFEPIVPYLGLEPGTAVRFVFPHALMRPITVNGGAVMRAWYDITDISTTRGQDEAGIRHSADKIRALVNHEIERGIPASRMILAGFSQGGAMALHVGLRYTEKLAGIMALSAYLLFPDRLESEHSEANSATPVFIGHGTQDPMVPVFLGEQIRSALKDGHWPVEWHSYPIPHSVSQPEIADVGRWLQGCFDSLP
jgi:phospholipase/carboxylesterase